MTMDGTPADDTPVFGLKFTAPTALPFHKSMPILRLVAGVGTGFPVTEPRGRILDTLFCALAPAEVTPNE